MLDDLDMLDAESSVIYLGDTTPGTLRRFTVDHKRRGEDTYVLHGAGDASGFAPGMTLYTPDGIIWDVISVDANRKGLTVSKKRKDVSFAAWLTGDWSSLSGEVPYRPPTPAQLVAEKIEEGRQGLKAAGSKFTRYLPWIVGGVVVIGVGSIAAPIVAPLLAHRALARRAS